MRQYIKLRCIRRLFVDRARVIHENKWSNHSSQTERKNAFHIHTRGNGCFAGFNDEIEHGVCSSVKYCFATTQEKCEIAIQLPLLPHFADNSTKQINHVLLYNSNLL